VSTTIIPFSARHCGEVDRNFNTGGIKINRWRKCKAQPRTALLQRHVDCGLAQIKRLKLTPGISNCLIRQSLYLAQQLSRHKIMHVESTEAPACLYNISIVFGPGTSDTEHRL
ncbi:uncharacterized protein Bfra_005926, partial [Botrytis fragariae]